jgi:2-keto-4-pentenoate hydratase/2-oxohepta-3-ene-1,7-dioic acid hydratase in catechol pathway
MIFKVDKIVSFISKIMTLFPGDIIATGTPSGIGQLEEGDIVKVEIEGIGILKNTVFLEKND